jgi:hypothetical protein
VVHLPSSWSSSLDRRKDEKIPVLFRHPWTEAIQDPRLQSPYLYLIFSISLNERTLQPICYKPNKAFDDTHLTNQSHCGQRAKSSASSRASRCQPRALPNERQRSPPRHARLTGTVCSLHYLFVRSFVRSSCNGCDDEGVFLGSRGGS